MNLDGLVVLRHVVKEGGLDDEVLLVELSSSVRQAIQAVASVEGGELIEFSMSFDAGSLVVRMLPDEHFVALLLDPPALAGKGRYVLRSRSQALIEEMF
jgi:hypothetical protein